MNSIWWITIKYQFTSEVVPTGRGHHCSKAVETMEFDMCTLISTQIVYLIISFKSITSWSRAHFMHLQDLNSWVDTGELFSMFWTWECHSHSVCKGSRRTYWGASVALAELQMYYWHHTVNGWPDQITFSHVQCWNSSITHLSELLSVYIIYTYYWWIYHILLG